MINYGTTCISAVSYNGVSLSQVNFNGTCVFPDLQYKLVSCNIYSNATLVTSFVNNECYWTGTNWCIGAKQLNAFVSGSFSTGEYEYVCLGCYRISSPSASEIPSCATFSYDIYITPGDTCSGAPFTCYDSQAVDGSFVSNVLASGSVSVPIENKLVCLKWKNSDNPICFQSNPVISYCWTSTSCKNVSGTVLIDGCVIVNGITLQIFDKAKLYMADIRNGVLLQSRQYSDRLCFYSHCYENGVCQCVCNYGV